MTLHPSRTLALALALAATVPLTACKRWRARRAHPRPPVGRVEPLATARTAPHAYSRAGDLVLHGTDGTALVIAATPDAPGHRPLRGAVVDLAVDNTDRADPLLYYRAAWIDAQERAHPLVAREVTSVRCAGGDAGVRAVGEVDGVTLERTVCAQPGGRFRVFTRAQGLPPGAHVGDELNVGTSQALAAREGDAWGESATSGFVAFGERGVAGLLEAPRLALRRRVIQIAAETFRDAIRVVGEGASSVRTLRVLRGDALDAVARAGGPARVVSLALRDGGSGEVSVLDDQGNALAQGELPDGAARTLRLPAGFGTRLLVRDARGVALDPIPLAAAPSPTPVAHTLAPPRAGVLRLEYTAPDGSPLPVHVLFRGLEGTPDPVPRAAGRAYSAGRSLYLLDGRAEVALAPGRYRVTASHGPTHALSSRDLVVTDGSEFSVHAPLARVVDTTGWTAGDFHLHAAPSPDSRVSLEERVAALACEGVELAVATDHNRVTDYAATARALGVDGTLATVSGAEVTSGGATLWGHFNAFPLAPRGGAPEDEAPAYFDTAPADVFAAARARGAEVLQVNHARMPPNIGYFDLAHVDARTGQADAAFAEGFDALEAFNGMWLETPERVREGVRDLVAMARRGRHVAATGNSDSHRLLFEEAGYPRTYVFTPQATRETRAALTAQGLLRGETTVSSGPFVELTVDGARPGATVRPGAGRAVLAHVKVSAPAWVPVERVELWVDGAPAFTFPVTGPAVDGVRFERDVRVPVAHDSVVLAWADAETPLPDVLPYPQARAIGFTGMVYVDADGDGAVRVPAAAP